jgi:membrane protease subunit HflK
VRDPKDTLVEVAERHPRGRGPTAAERSSKPTGAHRAGHARDHAADARPVRAGIEVVNVNITGVQVPEAVQAAQRDSVKAAADRERMVKEAQAYANNILPVAEGNAARAVQDAEAYKSQIVSLATGDASRFSQLALAYDKAPAVTRERLYIETLESVLKSSRKVLIDSKAGNGNMIYLPLDKLMERNRDNDANTVTVRPPVNAEPDSSTSPDSRQRVER